MGKKNLEMSVEKGIGTQKSKNVLASFRFFRLVKAAFFCRVRTLGVQEQVAEVAAERVVCRHQAQRAAVAAYLSGKQTGVQRSTPGGANAKMPTWWRTTLESLASQGSPSKKGTSQAP